jgi:hypothetical protein
MSSIISSRGGPDRLADHVGVLIEQHLSDALLDRHPAAPVAVGARLRRTVRSPTIMSATSPERVSGVCAPTRRASHLRAAAR